MVQQKSRQQWIRDGERNTSYFHASIKERAAMNSVTLQLEDGSWCLDNGIIGDMAVRFFKDLFTSTRPMLNEALFRDFPSKIGVYDNDCFNAFRMRWKFKRL